MCKESKKESRLSFYSLLVMDYCICGSSVFLLLLYHWDGRPMLKKKQPLNIPDVCRWCYGRKEIKESDSCRVCNGMGTVAYDTDLFVGVVS